MKGLKKKSNIIPLPEPAHWGVDEMNLAEFPVGLLSEYAPKGIKTIERQDTKWDPEKRQRFDRRVVITSTDKWGLPCAKDNDVLLALISLTKTQNNFEDRRVEFTRGQVARELGWDQNGRTYERIKKALHRLAGVRINAEQSWWDNQTRKYHSRDLGVIDEFDLYERYAGVTSFL